MVRQQKKNKTKSAQKDNTPTNHPNSGETGHFSEPENKRSSMTTRNETPVLTAGVAALTSGEVVSVLTGAAPPDLLKKVLTGAAPPDLLKNLLTGAAPPDLLKNSPQFVMAGNQDAFQMSGCTRMSAVDLQDEEGGGENTRNTSTTTEDAGINGRHGGVNT